MINYEPVRHCPNYSWKYRHNDCTTLTRVDKWSVNVFLWEFIAQQREKWMIFFFILQAKSQIIQYTIHPWLHPVAYLVLISGYETDSVFLWHKLWQLRNIIQTWFTSWNWFCSQVTSLNFLAESKKQSWTHWFQRLGEDIEGPLMQTTRPLNGPYSL